MKKTLLAETHYKLEYKLCTLLRKLMNVLREIGKFNITESTKKEKPSRCVIATLIVRADDDKSIDHILIIKSTRSF